MQATPRARVTIPHRWSHCKWHSQSRPTRGSYDARELAAGIRSPSLSGGVQVDG